MASRRKKTSRAPRRQRTGNEWALRCEWLKRKHLMMCQRANRQQKTIRILEAQLKVFEEELERRPAREREGGGSVTLVDITKMAKMEYRVERSQPPAGQTRVSARIGGESAQIDLRWDATGEEIEAAKAQLAATYRPHPTSASERTRG